MSEPSKSEKPKMFNRGIVFGSVLKKPVQKQTDGGSVYASIQLQCPNALHGDIRVWGKLWGAQIEGALSDLSPGDKIRCEGVVQQYDGQNGRITNFNFWAYRDCLKNELEELRAVYTIVGDVVGLNVFAETDELPEMIAVEISYQSGKEAESKYDPERYQFFIESSDPLSSMLQDDLIGKRVSISGMLRQFKDYFENEIAVFPSLKQIKVVWPKGDTNVPF